MIVKIMKGDERFRKKSKAFLQSSNEVLVYKTIIPYFEKYLDNVVSEKWIAQIFFADCDIFPKLGNKKETILALEDLNSCEYRLAHSKVDLDADHLKLMAKKIASYHAVSFALKIRKDPMLDKLASELIPFHYKSETQGDLETYKFLGPLSFKRLFKYVEDTSKHQDNKTSTKHS